MVINTNISALRTTRTLAESMNRVSKQIKQLSSGSKIVSPEDDAAGLSQSSKFGAQIRSINAAAENTQNYISYSQTQDGVLSTADKIVRRMNELSMLSHDETKSTADKANYELEFDELNAHLKTLADKTFNGEALFSKTITLFDGKAASTSTKMISISMPLAGNGKFTINLDFTGSPTAGQQKTFEEAAARWSQVIIGDTSQYGGEDDLTITVNFAAVDGVGGVLANAGTTSTKAGAGSSGKYIANTGTMNIDTADADAMEANETLYGVILHEMGHILGLSSTGWSSTANGKANLLTGASPNFRYTGTNALREYNTVFGTSRSNIPREDDGGEALQTLTGKKAKLMMSLTSR